MAKGKNKGNRNDDRPNGKAFKKHPKSNRKTGKTIGGYSPAKLAERAKKRANHHNDNRTTIS
jgi:hypothetical protein